MAPIPSHLLQLWQSGDRDALWAAYKVQWNASKSPPMDSEIFNFLFENPEIAKEARHLAARSAEARETMRSGVAIQNLDAFLSVHFDQGLQLLCALLNPDELIELWRQRGRLQIVVDRCRSTSVLVTMLVAGAGRAMARSIIAGLWKDYDLLKEERETILTELDESGALSVDFIGQLGPDAEDLARRLAARGDLHQTYRVEPASAPVFQVSAEVAGRLAALLETLGLETDLLEANLSTTEIERLKDGGCTSTLQSLRRRFPGEMVDELEKIARRDRATFLRGGSSFLIPLIRVLHMRLILEAPSLAPALARPEDSLVPEVLLYVLGRDAVDYVPELRIQAGVERRWRAKWAEITGEALSVLFLEEALGLDLPTLRRIPERNDRETPDFQASTLAGEPVVFESKGSTDFETHKRQRTKALGQVGKRGKGKRGANSWAEPGRSYACCLFAAQQRAGESSLFYVADPPFAFRDLFGEGWDREARRRHYAAVAEAAGLFDLADFILRRGRLPEERREPETFLLGAGEVEGTQFTGTYTWLRDQARRLRHPRPEVFDRIRMFTGLSSNLFRQLTKGQIPGSFLLEESFSRNEPEQPFHPRSGALPDPEKPGIARGVFSVLSNGSCLAFEVV